MITRGVSPGHTAQTTTGKNTGGITEGRTPEVLCTAIDLPMTMARCRDLAKTSLASARQARPAAVRA